MERRGRECFHCHKKWNQQFQGQAGLEQSLGGVSWESSNWNMGFLSWFLFLILNNYFPYFLNLVWLRTNGVVEGETIVCPKLKVNETSPYCQGLSNTWSQFSCLVHCHLKGHLLILPAIICAHVWFAKLACAADKRPELICEVRRSATGGRRSWAPGN